MIDVVLITGGNLGDVAINIERARLMLIRELGLEVSCSSVFSSEAWGFEAKERFLNQVIVIKTTLSPQAVLTTCHRVECELGRVRDEVVKADSSEPVTSSEVFISTVSNLHLTSDESMLCNIMTPSDSPINPIVPVPYTTSNTIAQFTPLTLATPDNLAPITSEQRTYSSRSMDIDILFYGNQVINETNLIVPHPHIAEREFVLRPLSEVLPKFMHPITGESVELMLQRLIN